MPAAAVTQAALHNERTFICVYGPSGAGKTTDTGRAFPNALFIAAPGALQSIRSTLGYEVASVKPDEVKTIQDATKLVTTVSKNGQYDAIVIDDFSFLAEQTFASLEKKLTGFKLWGELRDVTLEFRDAARYAKCHVALSCWETGPSAKPDGTRVRGGPMLSGRLPEQVPAMCDMVLRCGYEPMRKPWSGVYRCSLDPNYVMKDRLNVVPDTAPMNIGELLRLAGYVVPRHRELPWQEEVVESIAQNIFANDPSQDFPMAEAAFKQLVGAGVRPIFARTTVSDALDRAVLRRARARREGAFL